jgi:hypothetical protein
MFRENYCRSITISQLEAVVRFSIYFECCVRGIEGVAELAAPFLSNSRLCEMCLLASKIAKFRDLGAL